MDKKGFVGIGTLLIFIALVLVAAIAAGVFIRTSNSLQNRALTTGTVAREQVSAGIEIMSVRGYANITTNEVYGYEILVRALPSSRAVNPYTLFLVYRQKVGKYEALYQSPDLNSAFSQRLTGLSQNVTFADDLNGLSSVADMDDDNKEDAIGFTQTYVQGSDTDALILLLSSVYSDHNQWDLSSVRSRTTFGVYANITDNTDGNYTLYDNSTDQIYGFITGLNHSGVEYELVLHSDLELCDWTTIKRDTRFCMIERVGDGDSHLDESELWMIRYRLAQPVSSTPQGQDIEFRIVTPGGLTASQKMTIPNIVGNELLVLYP